MSVNEDDETTSMCIFGSVGGGEEEKEEKKKKTKGRWLGIPDKVAAAAQRSIARKLMRFFLFLRSRAGSWMPATSAALCDAICANTAALKNTMSIGSQGSMGRSGNPK